MERDSNFKWRILSVDGISACECEADTVCKSCYEYYQRLYYAGRGSEIPCPTQSLIPNDVLPSSAAERKSFPIATGCLDYFPDAIAAIAHLSWVGNEQHNPGEPLHWAREKSADQEDTCLRHFLDRGKIDVDGERHTTKFAWRALAMLQLELEAAK